MKALKKPIKDKTGNVAEINFNAYGYVVHRLNANPVSEHTI
jgi:hypothetical protein